MAIDTGIYESAVAGVGVDTFKVDSCTSVFADDNLDFIIPAIGTCSRLHTIFETITPTQHVLCDVCSSNGFRIVETHNEQSRIDNLKTFLVRRDIVTLSLVQKMLS